MPQKIKLRSDCCQAHTKRVREWNVCKKCGKRCFIERYPQIIKQDTVLTNADKGVK